MAIARRLAALALAHLVAAAPGSAATHAERRCQQALADAGRQLFQQSMGLLASCQGAVAPGRLPAGTDCLTHPATVAKRATAAVRAARRIRDACSRAAAASLRLGGACAGGHTPQTLAACIEGSHDADAALLVGVADAARDLLSGPAQRCQGAASQQARTFARARLALLQQCKRHPPRNLAPGSDCATAPRTAARIAHLRTAAAQGIVARCQDDALAGARFGAPCTAPATGDALAACLLGVAEAASDDALATEFPDTSFCGDAAAAVEHRIDTLLAHMTLAEKVEQMHGASLTGVAHTAPNVSRGIPGLVMVDGPRGVGVTLGRATAFPVGAARGATWDPALEERVGEAIGTEARAKGVDMILAPTINLLRHPRWGRAQETYGEDTVHVGRMAVGFIRGAQRHVIASAKHFAGNTIEATRFSVNVSVDERTLREVYLPHFRMAVQQGHTGSVMSAYNKVNGQYCGENVHLLHDVLKEDWGFKGFVESDWVFGTRSTAPAANAGLDIEMPAPIRYLKLADAVMAGQVSIATINAAVRRILRAQFCFRLDTDPPVPDPSQVETPAHQELARQVAREAIVLLKNDGGALPLERAQVGSIVVVGELAATANLGDLGSSTVVPSASIAPLDGIRAAAGTVPVTYLPGPTLSADDQATIGAAGVAVVVVGLDYRDEGEGQIAAGDRQGLALPRDQDQLVSAVAALNPRTVVVLEGSGAITIPWADAVAAVVMAWYPGEEGGAAIAEVLFGDVTPSGKLPVTFPRAEADLPPFDDVSLEVTYDYYHGYRYLDRHGTEPLFPFGFGLSYTTFRYAHLTVSPPTISAHGRVRVTADVTNTGAVPGDEVAQLYVGYQGSRVDRAVRDLKAFARIHLAPGETRTVPFDLQAADVAFWDSAVGAFVAEPITYEVHVGSSSRDLPLSGSFAVVP